MTQDVSSPFAAALVRVREVFSRYRQSPSVLLQSLELEDCTRAASRAAKLTGIPLVAASAEFGRAAAESFPTERIVGITIARTMTRWAAAEYHRAPVIDRAAS